jgi:hypothetical protein
MKTPLLEVRKHTLVIGSYETEQDQIDFGDQQRFGKYVVGGMLSNQGNDSVVIDGIITLATGETMPIGIGWPYIDKSIYTVKFLAGAGSPSRELVVMYYTINPKQCQS